MSKKKKRVAKTKQDYAKLKRAACEYVVVQGKTQREAAEILGVSEQSMSDWAKEGNWRTLRQGRQSAVSTTKENINQIIAIISGKRLALEYEIAHAQKIGDEEKELELRRKANAFSDELSKQNKALQTIDKENNITLGAFIDVMDEIFICLREFDEDLFDKTIDFQSQLIRRKTIELG